MLHPCEYWSMFITEDMLQEVLNETNTYKHRLLGSAANVRPGYLPRRCSWPPKWCARQKKDRTMDDLKKFLGTLYGLAAGDKGSCSVRAMCSDNPCTRVEWLARYGVTESWMTGWFQNIHLQPEGWEKTAEAKLPARNAKATDHEELAAPASGSEVRAEPASGSKIHNHNVKKGGRLQEQLNQNCQNVYKVHEMVSIDEQTALCNSRMCSLKHVQRHKKYDGIRIYSVNGSREIDAGYTQCYMVDWKCGYSTTTFADKLLEMMPKVWYSVYMDNAFPTGGGYK